jgi:hypothetical protein
MFGDYFFCGEQRKFGKLSSAQIKIVSWEKMFAKKGQYKSSIQMLGVKFLSSFEKREKGRNRS